MLWYSPKTPQLTKFWENGRVSPDMITSLLGCSISSIIMPGMLIPPLPVLLGNFCHPPIWAVPSTDLKGQRYPIASKELATLTICQQPNFWGQFPAGTIKFGTSLKYAKVKEPLWHQMSTTKKNQINHVGNYMADALKAAYQMISSSIIFKTHHW